MGTNYYFHPLPRYSSEECEPEPERIHICKCSAGWKVLFQGHPNMEPPIMSVKDWKRALYGGYIRDEYGDLKLESNFWREVASRQRNDGMRSHIRYFKEEYSNKSWRMAWPVDMADFWADPEGYEFDKNDFS